MKKRYLRPWIQNLITVVTLLLIILVGCANPSLSNKVFLMYSIPSIIICFFNLKLIIKYGR